MGSTTLATLTKSTVGSSDDLGALIHQLIAAALNGSLASILSGQSGMDDAFVGGDQEQSDHATRR
ncbi:hypothetical protein ACGFYT_01585 [Streptomyces sp. NPDC048208]|uniref:hypothetical protein n=1 Tax=Streptomyces sp. NPDC048208 TaxID=3365515 RepID=UPI00371DE6A8